MKIKTALIVLIIICFGEISWSQSCNFNVVASPDTMLCEPDQVQLNAQITGNIPIQPIYQWTPTIGLNNPSIPNPVATVNNTTNYSVMVSAVDFGNNLIINGDFEAGNTGFTTSYTIGTGGTWGPVSNPGTYLITTNPNIAHSNFASCADHTPLSGVNMMVANGATAPNTDFWCQTLTVNPNTNYVFEMWGISTVGNNPAVLALQFNGLTFGNTFNLPLTTCNWQYYSTTWNSGTNTSLTICIRNQNTVDAGNDFAIDDIALYEVCRKTDTVTITQAAVQITNIDTTICEGDAVLLGGTMQSTAGTYYDTLSSIHGCDSVLATMLHLQAPSKPQLGLDTTLCGNDPYLLASQVGNVTYAWSNNATDSTIIVTTADEYSLTVTDADGCTNADTIQVNYNPYPLVNLGNDTFYCPGDMPILDVDQDNINAVYEWQDGSINPMFTVSEPGGIYAASVTVDNCTEQDTVYIGYQVCGCIIAVPNVFTPNGDGNNDILRPLLQDGCEFSRFEFRVFNRWGQLVYQTDELNAGWDGRINGKLQPQDTYIWMLSYTLTPIFQEPSQNMAGDFLLLK